MIKRAKGKMHSPRLHFSVQDATTLPYASKTFDAVIISNALHSMPYPEKVLSEARRVLKYHYGITDSRRWIGKGDCRNGIYSFQHGNRTLRKKEYFAVRKERNVEAVIISKGIGGWEF